MLIRPLQVWLSTGASLRSLSPGGGSGLVGTKQASSVALAAGGPMSVWEMRWLSSLSSTARGMHTALLSETLFSNVFVGTGVGFSPPPLSLWLPGITAAVLMAGWKLESRFRSCH